MERYLFVFNSFAAATDIVDDGKTGILVSPFSIREYVQKLSVIMADDRLRREMTEACMKAVGKFDVKHVVDQWETIFKSLKPKS
uniref:CAZy families GT4 protein n=1 Tax=uncultured Alistipes sp. TaxID=538949 RepID=A0A060BRY3_9BACT|nr:CAZy families GT4 protein [uncultured Alistipes sp.]